MLVPLIGVLLRFVVSMIRFRVRGGRIIHAAEDIVTVIDMLNTRVLTFGD